MASDPESSSGTAVSPDDASEAPSSEEASLPLPDTEPYLGEETAACYEALCAYYDGSDSEKRDPAPAPSELFASLRAENGLPYFCLYNLAMTHVVRYVPDPSDGYLLDRAAVLLSGIRLERSDDFMDRENVPGVSEFLFFSSPDGTKKLYLFPDSGGQIEVLSVDGESASLYRSPPSEGTEGTGSLYEEFRFLYDGLDCQAQDVAFPAESAEEAVRLYAEVVYGYRFLLTTPGNRMKASSYKAIEYGILQKNPKGSAVIMELTAHIAPLDPVRRAFAEIFPVRSGEDAGMAGIYREFLLEKGDDGLWRCTESATSGLELP